MNSLERVLTALNLEKPDRVPLLEWSVNPKVSKVLEPDLNSRQFMAKHLDVITTFWSSAPESADDITKNEDGTLEYTDHWGIRRKDTGQDYPFPIGHPIQSPEDLADYTPPDPLEDQRLKRLRDVVDEYKGEKAICLTLNTTFTDAWGLVGMEEFFKYTIKDPEFAHELCDMTAKYHYKLAKEAIDTGAEIIMCGDDLAYKKGTMLSMDAFESFLLPHYSKIADIVHDRDAYFIKHTDGDIWNLIDPFISIGADAINPIEPSAGMDIGEVKDTFGGRICIVGNIDCGDLLSRQEPEDVRRIVKDTIEKAGKGGGYILASDNEIHASVKPENYRAMLKAASDYGRY